MRFVKAIALIAFVWAGQVPAAPDIQHWQTANGARVYFVAAPELPMVDVRVVFDAGSAQDAGKPGLAVLTNGLLAEGAGGLDANAIAGRFDGLGARYSATALRDMAIVSLRSLTDPALLEPALKTLALILRDPAFPANAVERERRRTLVALRSQEEDPGEIAERAFYRALYGDHPYASPPLGTTESVRSLTRDDLVSHYRRYYVARNAVVAIVGALDRAQAEGLADTVVGGLPSGEAAPPLPEVHPLGEARRIAIPFPSTQTHVLMGQPGMRRGDPDFFPLYVGNHILGGNGLVSRISEEVREKRGLSYSAYSYFAPMARKGPYVLGLQTRTEKTDEALEVLRATLARFVAGGPTEQELTAAKRNITGGFPLRIDSNSDIVQYLAMIGFYGLPLDYLDTFNAGVQAVTAAQIRDAFGRRIHPDAMVTVTVGGGT